MKTKTMKHALTCLLALLLAPLAGLHAAELKLPALFTDHMVLQREQAVPVWGTSAPGEIVTVEFAGQKKSATADANGTWLVKLDPLTACAEPRELNVGGIAIHDVLVGEVWLGSGQSNMAFGMRSQKNFAALKPSLNFPTLRFFTALERPTDTAKTPPRSQWSVCKPETVEACSAVLFFFGRELQEKLSGVPVGLINASVGGTSIKLWLDRDVQLAQPQMREGVESDELAHAKFDEAGEMRKYYASSRYTDWQAAVEKAKAAGQPLPRQPYTPLDTHQGWQPAGTWFKVRIAPLIPFGIRGMVWYQGEADGNIPNGLRYRQQLPALVRDWRARWGNPDMPFVWVQLPYWKAAPTWSAVRESQLKTLAMPHTGLVVTLDIGDPNDVHPGDKTQVGQRLAQWALGEVYRQEVETSGPLPLTQEVHGSECRVRFQHAAGLAGKGGAVKGFTLAGADKQWHPATGCIAGDTIVVSAPEVPVPIALRYAWDGNPENCNLYNGAGLPASPFRTDDWELK